jgi:hypothetical protein
MQWDSFADQIVHSIHEYGRAARDAALKGDANHSAAMEQKWLDELEYLHKYLAQKTLLDALKTVIGAIRQRFGL